MPGTSKSFPSLAHTILSPGKYVTPKVPARSFHEDCRVPLTLTSSYVLPCNMDATFTVVVGVLATTAVLLV